MILFYDTETTGMLLWHLPSDHPSQPHLVQLAAVIVGDDPAAPVKEMNRIVRPDGWEIPADVAAIHGITTERAMDEGVPLRQALDEFDGEFVATCGEVGAFNNSFDRRVMRTAYMRSYGRAGMPGKGRPTPRHFCMMKALTPIINLPPTAKMVAAGFNKPKPPKLSEAHRWAFKADFDGAHDAINDVRATVRLYHHFVENHGRDALVWLADKD